MSTWQNVSGDASTSVAPVEKFSLWAVFVWSEKGEQLKYLLVILKIPKWFFYLKIVHTTCPKATMMAKMPKIEWTKLMVGPSVLTHFQLFWPKMNSNDMMDAVTHEIMSGRWTVNQNWTPHIKVPGNRYLKYPICGTI